MTIRAQQLQIAKVGGPILEPAAPCVARAGFDLFAWIDVVNVQRARVVKTAADTLTAKLCHQFQFSRPIARVFMNRRAVLIPICLLALRRTVAYTARLAAVFTRTIAVPSVGKIALLTTEFPGPVSKPICVHPHWLATPSACDRHWFLSHARNVTRMPKYFDIACRRISDELKRPRLPLEEPKKQIQEALL